MILNIDGISKTYKQGTHSIPVLKDLSLQVNKGETVAILGESGSGKSTLLSLMSGLDKPDEGSISIEGQNIVEKNQDELASFRGENIGIVFQQFHLVPYLTAIENVSLPLEILRQAELGPAREALRQVGLADREKHFSNQLSGGECQRVAMARAIVARPKLLLADEPSGNLDTKTGAKIMDMLFEIIQKNQMTALLVTHSKELASRCQRQLVLKDGKLHS